MAKNTSSRYARSPAPERRPEVDSKERLRPRPRPRPPHDGHRSDRRSGDDQSALALMNRRREERRRGRNEARDAGEPEPKASKRAREGV